MKYTFNVFGLSDTKIEEMYEWCRVNLYHGEHFFYEPSWYFDDSDYYFEFTDEQEFIWFKLRWA